jgi:hypothetical protein
MVTKAARNRVIYSPRECQVKNAKIAVLRGICRELPLFDAG